MQLPSTHLLHAITHWLHLCTFELPVLSCAALIRIHHQNPPAHSPDNIHPRASASLDSGGFLTLLPSTFLCSPCASLHSKRVPLCCSHLLVSTISLGEESLQFDYSISCTVVFNTPPHGSLPSPPLHTAVTPSHRRQMSLSSAPESVA
jgi:hypothetical protein